MGMCREVVEISIPRLFLQGQFERPCCLVGLLAQFGRHHQRQRELLEVGDGGLLKLRQVGQSPFLVAEPRVGERSKRIRDGGVRCLLYDDVQVVDRLLIFAKLVQRLAR